MKFIKKFKQLDKHDAKIAGGKGASLGEMTQAGIQVPPGFVVVADAFDKFIEEVNIKAEIEAILSKVNTHEMHSVEVVSETIRSLIANSKMPKEIGKEIESSFGELGAKFVAVRSSATAEDSVDASWAGELESYLDVRSDDLLGAVQKCWSSLFTPRAIFYRFEKKLHLEHVSVAVVVQKMVKSEVSGITFTVHPVTENVDQMVIEAGWGLGEAIVGGIVTPDNYVIGKDDLEIIDTFISDQEKMIARDGDSGTIEKKVPASKISSQKLSGKNIIKLAKICIDIETHYDLPQDIEWAIEKDKIYIVQSRPITTLNQ